MNPKSWAGVKGCPNLSYSPQSILDLFSFDNRQLFDE